MLSPAARGDTEGQHNATGMTDFNRSVTEEHVTNVSSPKQQLMATVKRQITQKLRSRAALLIEMLLPAFFVLALSSGNSASSKTMTPGAAFIAASNYQSGRVNFPDPSVLIKERFCYNGSRMTSTEASQVVLGGDCTNLTNLWCNAGQGPATCAAQAIACSDSYASSFNIPGGFCFYSDAVKYTQTFEMQDAAAKILDLNAMVLMQWMAIISNGGPSSSSVFGSKPILQSGPLNFSPNTESTTSLITLLNSSLPVFRFIAGKTFASRADAVTFLSSVQGEGNWGLIDVDQLSSTGLAISIALNNTAIPATTSVLSRFSGGLGSKSYKNVMDSGFMTIQSEISRLYLTNILNVSSGVANEPLVVAPMGYQAYFSSTFLTIVGSSLAPLTLVLSFLYTVSQLSKLLVEEKELRLREGAMVMGLGKFAFYASWFLTYLVQVLISSVIITIFVHNGLLEQSAVLIVFCLYFLFSTSTVLLAALLSSVFSKSKTAALVVPLLYFGLSIPSFSLSDTTSAGVYIILSFFSPTAFGIGTRLLFDYEVNDGMGWGDVTSSEDTVNMALVFFMLILDCGIYLLLTLYLDEVMPGEWGSSKHPLFCFYELRDRITGTKRVLDRVSALDYVVTTADGSAAASAEGSRLPIPSQGRSNEFMEEYPPSSNASVRIQALRKEFTGDSGTKVAVDDLDLKFFPDQITVLLGHNGAGKTTTMNMITGMLPISSGDCTVYGKSSRYDIQQVRSEIGYCPQHNILWDNLTCAEHLRYFAALKGVQPHLIEAQVDEMLTKVDLPDKKDFFSSQLSGGQKRKLSVAIAFIGGSRLILLDEPTAGMDVAARRHTWDLLKEMSKGRTIILTTHFMDEADLLGNRIAIMSKGSLHSYGSSTFLKSRLGTGYMLRVSLEPPAASDDLAAMAAKSQATASSLLIKIQSFIPDAVLKEAKGQEIAYSLPMKDAPKFADVVSALEQKAIQAEHRLSGVSMSVSTLEDVFVRIAEEDHGPHDPSPSPISEQEHLHPSQSQETVNLLTEVYSRMDATPCQITFVRQFYGLLLKRFHNARRDRRALVLQVIVPLLCIFLAMLLSLIERADSNELWIDGSMYASKEQQIPVTGAGLCESIAPNLDKYSTAAYRAFENLGNQSFDLSTQLVSEFKSHGNLQRMVALSCTDVGYNLTMTSGNGSVVVYQTATATVALFNASSQYSLPQAVAAFYNGVAGTYGATSSSPTVPTIRIASHPLPLSAGQSASIDGITNLMIGIFIMIPFTFIPSTYVAWIVKERQCKAKHLQIVSGMNFIAYWGSNFVFDILSFLVTEVIVLIIFRFFDRTEYIGGDVIGGTIFLFTFYTISQMTSGNGGSVVVYQTATATVALFNASSQYSLPQAVAAFYNGVAGTYGAAVSSSSSPAVVVPTIRIASHPLPLSAGQSASIDGITNLMIGIFIMIPFTFIPSTYVAWIVKERQCKAKHLQIVSGMNFIAYWGSNFVFDILSFLVTEVIVLIIFRFFDRTEYIGGDVIGGTIFLFTFYGASGIVWAYLFSFLFDNHGSAQNITMLANFLAGFVLVIVMYILRLMDSTAAFADVFVYFCRLIPAYSLGDGIITLANTNALTGSDTNIWAMDKLGWDIFFMAFEIVLFASATLLWDHPQRQLRKQQLLFDRNAEAPPVTSEDSDVLRERREVESNAPTRQSDVVKVRKLRKVYDNGKVAVQNVTFGVKAGEVFGFLGTNGAGKTTTMSILTSEFLPTMGHCSIGGFDVVEQAAEAQRILGFCPQFDALHDLMTSQEHLQLYAALRGVSLRDTTFVVNALLTSCDIAPFRNVPSKKLSGGNKRKLSVAISLIGAPRLVLLDEPSAGMDPLARREYTLQ
ncbi:ABC transporter, putative [Bodo saltans]|uniref:ABC transporter, putative n=1 Tax=Bodo saltans TaxID=75058 RepID=A0A0S4JTU9_BODSA|nr:ABC transporter, putative [Bodo saltans]|eukprot:CUG91981.1 ABC transporter, putative [Bodo saltans]